MQITTTRDLNVPPSAAWQVFGERFADVADWASSITRSRLEGSLGEGAVRTCDIKQVGPVPAGQITEELTRFDREQHALDYTVLTGSPGFIRHLENRWTLQPTDDGHTRIESQLVIELAWWAMPMWPVMRRELRRQVGGFIGQLAHHVEGDAKASSGG